MCLGACVMECYCGREGVGVRVGGRRCMGLSASRRPVPLALC